MLIVKNLKKTYKTKGGVEVHALDDVSITFPENGMAKQLYKANNHVREFSGGSVVKALCSQHGRRGFDPWSGNCGNDEPAHGNKDSMCHK